VTNNAAFSVDNFKAKLMTDNELYFENHPTSYGALVFAAMEET